MYYYSKLWLSVKFFSIISGEEDEVCNRARARLGWKKSGFASRVNPPRNPNNSPQKRKMILTNCAACAAPLAHNAPRCVRCKVRRP